MAARKSMTRYVADFRSDTVTRPSPAMRRAMATAEVGDDVLGDDPTVLELERRAAALLKKPAALFVASGSMGNLVAATVQVPRGGEMIVGALSHMNLWEGASAAQIAGINKAAIPENDDGSLEPAKIAAAIQPDDVHTARTALVCWEITHNSKGGAIPDFPTLQAGVRLARKRGLKTHLDGARLFSAVVETGVSASRYAALFDTVTFCLSKNLGAPIGSMLAGSKSFIHEARRLRKMLGGGWRQAGILAAAGLYALDHNIPRHRQDHRLARRLAAALCRFPGVALAQRQVDSNIVYLSYRDPAGRRERSAGWLVSQLQRRGIGCLAVGNNLRFVTHLDVNDRAVDALIKAAHAVLHR